MALVAQACGGSLRHAVRRAGWCLHRQPVCCAESGTAGDGQNYFLGVYYNGGDAPTPGGRSELVMLPGLHQGRLPNYARCTTMWSLATTPQIRFRRSLMSACHHCAGESTSPVIQRGGHLRPGRHRLMLTDGLWNFPSARHRSLRWPTILTEALETLDGCGDHPDPERGSEPGLRFRRPATSPQQYRGPARRRKGAAADRHHLRRSRRWCAALVAEEVTAVSA